MSRRDDTPDDGPIPDIGDDVRSTPDDLPELAPGQHKFVLALLAGDGSAVAYRKAYDCSRSSDMTVWVNACRLRKHPKVQAWLKVARDAHVNAACRSLETHIRALEDLKERALDVKDYRGAIKAEELIGRASGLYVERHQEVPADDPEALRKELEELRAKHAAETRTVH